MSKKVLPVQKHKAYNIIMKRIIIPTILILAVIIIMAFIFDWGRGKVKPSEINQNASTTETIQPDSFSTSSMPIVVSYPVENQEVSSPIVIVGKARGNWYFEATFPVELVDNDGNILASTAARAETDWATTSF